MPGKLTNCTVILLAVLSACAPVRAGATIALQPVRADGDFTVVNQEIFVPSGGTRVFVEVRIANWGPFNLKVFQVAIDPSGYLNATSSIGPVFQPCSGSNSAGHAQCAAAFGAGSRCSNTQSNGTICDAGFQATTRPDWIGYGYSVISAVDTSTEAFRYGMTTQPPDSVEDLGGSRYAGTLVLNIPPAASGTFVVNLAPRDTFLQDATVPVSNNIPIETLAPAIITVGDPVAPKCRYLAFEPEPAGELTAVRVTLTSLNRPTVPNGSILSDFSDFEGQVRWLGPPMDFPERTSSPATFRGAALQCAPYFTDWGSLGVIQVFGDAVLPSSEYTVRQLPISCQSTPDDEQCYTAPVMLRTAQWGDVFSPYARIDQPLQPDMVDLAQIIDAFRGLISSPSKTQVQLRGNVVDVLKDVNFVDVTLAADAIRRLPYPYPGPTSCP